MPITNRRKGYRARSRADGHRRFALGRLKVHWRKKTRDELESLLRLVAIAEHKTRPHDVRRREPPLNPWLRPRLRRRRLEIAERLLLLGGRVNQCLYSRVLPRRKKWPGALALVGKKAVNVRTR